jgi:SAM-dependent methyltransferase
MTTKDVTVAVPDAQALQMWELAEVQRSSYEAARINGLRPTSARMRRRYADPPASTVFPLEYAFHLAGDVEGANVLDFGCGTGKNASILAARGARVWALDISPDLLALATRRAHLDGLTGAITTVCGSAHAIPLPDASIDLVFGNAILHHLDLALTAREVYRILKPGGRAVFKEPMRNSRAISYLRRLVPYHSPDISPHERPLRWSEIEQFASRFRMGRHREFTLPLVSLAKIVRLPHGAVTPLRHVEHAVMEHWPVMAWFAGVSVFELTKPQAFPAHQSH